MYSLALEQAPILLTDEELLHALLLVDRMHLAMPWREDVTKRWSLLMDEVKRRMG